MTKEEYFKLLNNHDWFYDYSDDHRVWTAGREASERIRYYALQSEEFMVMYKSFVSYINRETDTRPTLEDF
jgi:hypothetical protein